MLTVRGWLRDLLSLYRLRSREEKIMKDWMFILGSVLLCLLGACAVVFPVVVIASLFVKWLVWVGLA